MAKLHIVCFFNETSDWRLECFAVASGMNSPAISEKI